MSISWKPTQTINTPLSKEVIQQFNTRREILSKTNSITDEELKFLHSNTGWVKVSSGVDELIKKDSNEQPSVNSLAKQNILLGGTFDSGSGIKQGILSDNSSYSFSEQYGYRPMAGITSFSIVNLDSTGAVRKATIDFSVNSLEDLTKFEKLYLRPGFTAFVEFGHSISLKIPYENGPYYFENIVEYFDDFFDNIEGTSKDIEKKQDESEVDFKNRQIQYNSNSRLKKIELEIQKLKKNSGYNYDAMLGRISNFKWSYNVDTTYDCSFDIMGYGSVIESLSALSSENIGDNEDDKSDAKTSIGNKFDAILSLGVESDPFVSPDEGADETKADDISDTGEPQAVERNPIIAAVTHYACKEGDEEVVFSNEKDSDFRSQNLDGQNFLQVGQVFEFVKGEEDPRFIKATTVEQRKVLSDWRGGKDKRLTSNDSKKFIVVNVIKDGVIKRGFIATTIMANIFRNEILGFVGNNQPTKDVFFPFIHEDIPQDGTIKKVGSLITIAADRQKHLNDTYGNPKAAPVVEETSPDLSKLTEKQVPVVEGLLARGYKLGIGTVLIDRKYGTGNNEREDSDKGLVVLTKPGTLGRTDVTKVLSDGRSSDYVFNPN
jgi:hypothetical protein